jgi:hypothetical protein
VATCTHAKRERERERGEIINVKNVNVRGVSVRGLRRAARCLDRRARARNVDDTSSNGGLIKGESSRQSLHVSVLDVGETLGALHAVPDETHAFERAHRLEHRSNVVLGHLKVQVGDEYGVRIVVGTSGKGWLRAGWDEQEEEVSVRFHGTGAAVQGSTYPGRRGQVHLPNALVCFRPLVVTGSLRALDSGVLDKGEPLGLTILASHDSNVRHGSALARWRGAVRAGGITSPGDGF